MKFDLAVFFSEDEWLELSDIVEFYVQEMQEAHEVSFSDEEIEYYDSLMDRCKVVAETISLIEDRLTIKSQGVK